MSVGFTYPLTSDELARTTPASSYAIRVEIGGVAETVPFPASGTLTAGRFFWTQGDRLVDADGGVGGVGCLLGMLETALNAHSSTAVVSITRGADGRWTIACTTNFRVLWGNVATTIDARAFGFTQADPGAAAASFLAPALPRGLWAPPGVWPRFDSRPIAARRAGTAVSLSGRVRTATWAAGRARRRLRFAMVLNAFALDEYAGAGAPFGTLERVWDALSRGRPVRYLEDVSVPNAYRLWASETALERREEWLQRDDTAPQSRHQTSDLQLVEVLP